MKKREILLVAVLVATWAPAEAQDEIPEFNKLRTPMSPAFVILGTTPAEVQRPNTPSSFAVSLLQGFAPPGSGEGSDGFALETAPYWLMSHPRLTLRQYYNASFLQNLVRTFTVSGATVGAEDTDAPSGSSRDLGVGVRTRIFHGAPPSDSCVTATQQTVAGLQSIATFIATRAAPILKAHPEWTQQQIEALNDSLFLESFKHLSPADKKVVESTVPGCTAILSARNGFVMDVAAASAWRFPDGEVDDGRWRAGSVWVTPSLILRNLSWVGVARYTWSDDADDQLDLGVRGIYAWRRYGASLEAVMRRPKSEEDRYRVGLILDVLLMKDVWLTTSFGREFTGDDAGSLVALANLQWNIGDRSIKPDRR